MTTTAPPDGRTAAELVALRRRLAQLEQLVGLPAPDPRAVPPTGYRLVEPDDVVQADDHNLVMNQAVPRFPNAETRAVAIPAPERGMLSYLADAGRYESYDGTAWGSPAPGVRAWESYRGVAASANGNASSGMQVTTDPLPAGAYLWVTISASVSSTTVPGLLWVRPALVNATVVNTALAAATPWSMTVSNASVLAVVAFPVLVTATGPVVATFNLDAPQWNINAESRLAVHRLS